MVQRDWQPKNINDTFFPITRQPVSWRDNYGHEHRISGKYAIVDVERQNALGIVSENYNIITNREAYEYADLIIQAVFNGKRLSDFKCYNYLMPSTRSYCRIDLIIPDEFVYYGNEQWIPFVRITNSYNCTLVLRFEIGFCRWICKNGCIFGGKSFSFSITHNERNYEKWVGEIIRQAKAALGDVNDIWSAFKRDLDALKSITLPEMMALPMYCKAYGVFIDKKKVTDKQKETWAKRAAMILNGSKSYFEELGNNAYALFNVLTDYASFPEEFQRAAVTNNINSYQRKVMTWAQELISESSNETFSLSKYIGDEIMDTAFYLEALVKHPRE